MRRACLLLVLLLAPARAADGNRLAYLESADPYYVGRHFPKLTTPMWVGEPGVEAVVILGIDDMRGPEKWEAFLRPLLERLKKVDGRAPVSIMTCQVDPNHPQLQTWLKEGLSLECHTVDHPCPILKGGDLAQAKSTYDRCVDLLASVPGNAPVAFRTPCCDSLNTFSPRLVTEIINRTTPQDRFLQVDTSVFNLPTADDPELPRDLVFDADGRERFRKYLPADRTFVNYVEDYPYPYVIGGRLWEFPCAVPSDWSAQHRHGSNHPVTLRDWQAGLDAAVLKQGVYCLVFHPHGWCKSEQLVQLVDYAVAKHGTKVRFLTFREALERLNRNLLVGNPLKDPQPDRTDGARHGNPEKGRDNGVRLLDLNGDGYLDVYLGVGNSRLQSRLWVPGEKRWRNIGVAPTLVGGFHANLGPGQQHIIGRNRLDHVFTILHQDGAPTVCRPTGIAPGAPERAWFLHFDGQEWVEDPQLTRIAADAGPYWRKHAFTADCRFLFRDVDGDGLGEAFLQREGERAGFRWSPTDRHWVRIPYALPFSIAEVGKPPAAPDFHFVDLNGDGVEDLVRANEGGSEVWLHRSAREGWGQPILAAKAGQPGVLPPLTRIGRHNGFFVHGRSLWWQNEQTDLLKDLVDRRSFTDLLRDVEPGPKSPAAAQRLLKPRPGFVAELVAAEPLVQDPIAFAFGPDGKLWVAEMADYPLGVDGKGKPGGRVRFLESTRGDGKYDKSTLFLDNVPFPTGVLPWRNGVLVSGAPDVFFAEDVDGDGRADRRLPLFTGFAEGNQQHRVNGLVLGIDNWVYLANGDSGGKVKSLKIGKVIDIRGRDLRLRPDTGEIEATTGQTQFGRNADDWGNWFGGNNANPMWHYALDDHYLRRNPHVAAPDLRLPVPAVPGVAPVFPLSRTLPRFNDLHTANRFTSACSPIVYRDDLFGPHFSSSTFVSEPVHNLVHREEVWAEGATFRSRRGPGEEASEFLASADNWFRPTMLRTGPDGALWVADMYRHVIEHPEWIPKDWQKRLDLRAGHDRGRLYRVYPVGATPRPIPRLDRLDTAGLVAALDSPSGWQRDTAQQLLAWRNDRVAVPLLEKLAATSARPLTRLHALAALDGMGTLQPPVLARALADPHPGVRRHAVRLSEPHLDREPALGAALLKLVDDVDAPLRLQLACTLGAWHDPRAGAALGSLALRASGDRILMAAVLSSVNKDNLEEVMRVAASGIGQATAETRRTLLVELLRQANALGHDRATAALLETVGTPEKGGYAAWQFAALAGLLDALDARGYTLHALGARGDDGVKAAVRGLAGLFAEARRRAADPKAPLPERVSVIRLLGRGVDGRDGDVAALAAMLSPQSPDELQSAAIAGLGRLREERVPSLLLAGWRGFGPARRAQVLDELLGREAWAVAVLDAVGSGGVAPTEVDSIRRQRLLQYSNKDLRTRAEKLFAAGAATRQSVVDDYRSALTAKGDAARGQALFTKHCATCHRLAGAGADVGPDLGALTDRSPEYLLVSILDPNRAVEARYVNYLAETKAGRTYAGVLASETATSVTLVGPDGKPQVILRTDVESLASSGKSAMPEGLEKDIPPPAMADLLAYVRGALPARKRKVFEGNRPEVVRPDDGGLLRLTALNGEIYGTTLVLEKTYGNLGYWSSNDDEAAWELEVAKAGRYAVLLDYACHNDTAGNVLRLEAGGAPLDHRVGGSGTWDNYRVLRIGELELKAGRQRLTARAAGEVRNAVIDLRGIRLVPAP